MNQFGHDYIHFDGSEFKAGFEYISNQKQAVMEGIQTGGFSFARRSLGRLTHTWQDFYSHSNYVKLWLSKKGRSRPDEIDFYDPDLINHPKLRSGKSYGLIELFAMLPLVSKWIKPHMPADSHARMNLDSPSSGDLFEFVFMAALKQTTATFEQLMGQIIHLDVKKEAIRSFLGKQWREERYNHVYEYETRDTKNIDGSHEGAR